MLHKECSEHEKFLKIVTDRSFILIKTNSCVDGNCILVYSEIQSVVFLR